MSCEKLMLLFLDSKIRVTKASEDIAQYIFQVRGNELTENELISEKKFPR